MKKFGWIVLCMLLAGGAWWWTHRASYTSGEEFLALPADVDVVSSHDQPAGRLADLVQNPVIRLALQAGESDLEAIDAFCQDPNQMRAIAAILPKRLLLAHLPDARNPEGTWLGVSWIGNQGTQFNFLAGLLAGDALEQVKHASGHTLWRVTASEEELQTYFAVGGELLLMSVGFDESGMLRMLDTLARGEGSLDPALLFGEGAVAGPYPDRGMLRTGQGDEAQTIHFDIEEARKHTLQLLLEFPDPTTNAVASVPDAKILESFNALVGNRAKLGVMMPASWAASLGEYYLDNVWGAVTGDLFHFLGTRPVFLSAFDGDMGGQVKILRVPSLTLAIPITNQEEGETLMQEMLLKANERLPFNLFNEQVQGREKTWAIVSAARNGYRALQADERGGYRIMGRWLLLSTSLRTLAKLPVGAGTETSHAVEPGWGLTYGWIDLPGSMKSVRNGLSMYMLPLAFDSSDRAAELRSTLLMYRDWAELAGQCGTLQFSTQKVDHHLRLRVQQSISE